MKNLEIEYKNQIELEIPDLWSRIEAGVDAYEASKLTKTTVAKANDNINNVKSSANNVTSINSKINNSVTENDATGKVDVNDNVVSIKKKKNIARFVPYISAAACLLLVIGVLRMTSGLKTAMAPAMDSAPMADAAACESATDSYTAESPAMAEEATYDESPAMEEATGDTSSIEQFAKTEEDNAGLSGFEDSASESIIADNTQNFVAAETKDETEIEDIGEYDLVADLTEKMDCKEKDLVDVLETLKAAGIELDSISRTKYVVNDMTILMIKAGRDTYFAQLDVSDTPYQVVMIIKDSPDGDIIYQQ